MWCRIFFLWTAGKPFVFFKDPLKKQKKHGISRWVTNPGYPTGWPEAWPISSTLGPTNLFESRLTKQLTGWTADVFHGPTDMQNMTWPRFNPTQVKPVSSVQPTSLFSKRGKPQTQRGTGPTSNEQRASFSFSRQLSGSRWGVWELWPFLFWSNVVFVLVELSFFFEFLMDGSWWMPYKDTTMQPFFFLVVLLFNFAIKNATLKEIGC